MGTIPQRIKAQPFDKVVIAFRYIGEMVIHVEMHFGERLDRERLARAALLALDAEPILGCRFVTDVTQAYWERVEPAERHAFVAVTSEAEYEAFKLAPHDIDHTVAFKVCLWSAPEGDWLIAKVAHEAADAGGAKEAVRVLADIYTRLKEDPSYVPLPNRGSRGAWQALKHLPFTKYPGIFLTYLTTQLNHILQRPAFMFPMLPERQGRPFYVVRHISKGRLARARAKYKPAGATINDLILTAFLRAVMIEGRWDGTSNLRTFYTVDLRKHYIPGGRTEAVCNMSGLEFINLGKEPGGTAAETLAKVVAQSATRKCNYPGVSDAIGGVLVFFYMLPAKISAWLGAKIFQTAVKHKVLTSALTNMGPIEKSYVTFDTAPVAAWLIVPPIYPPMMGLGLSGYDGGITISFGGYRPAIDPEKVNRLFDRMEAEMPGLE